MPDICTRRAHRGEDHDIRSVRRRLSAGRPRRPCGGGAGALIVESLDAGRGETLDAALQRLARPGGGEASFPERPALRDEASRIGLALADLFGGADTREIAALLRPDRANDGRNSGEPEAACGCGGTADGGMEGTEFMLMSSTTSTSGGNYEDLNGNGQWDEGEPLVATGTRPSTGFSTGPGDTGGVGGTPVGEGSGTPGGSGGGTQQPAPTPPGLECLSESELAQLSSEEREAYLVTAEAAEIGREIQAQPDRDSREYASLIYRDVNGVITHTPIEPGGPTSSTANMIGIQSWGQVLGYVHSHTAMTWSGEFPDYKLYPTPDSGAVTGQGDWSAFDQMAAYISAAGGDPQNFKQFVLGPTGPVGSDKYELRGYAADDRDTTTLGQKIDSNLGTCDG